MKVITTIAADMRETVAQQAQDTWLDSLTNRSLTPEQATEVRAEAADLAAGRSLAAPAKEIALAIPLGWGN